MYVTMVYLLQYIRGTVQMGIRFSGSRFDMHVDWAGDVLTRRSTTGYVVFSAGGPLAWGLQLQATVATFSLQSEYQASDGVVSGGVVGDFTSFVQTHSLLFR